VALAVLVLAVRPGLAVIPLPSSPSWTSSDNDYSTGGALADVDGDGWIDLLTSNGNDMNPDRNGVYMNRQGILENVASWRSQDAGYFGHCYAGDVDNDGDLDLAVAYLGREGAGEMTARVYRNEAGTLGPEPWWKARDRHSSFDCCLGDVDNDGDLDLAISAGDAYRNETDSVRIYRNHGGGFDTLPYWTAHNGNCSDAVRFADIDNDGDLDLFVGQVIPTQDRGFVAMYRNEAGALETEPSWVARLGVGWVLRLALDDYDGDGFLDLACASNNQTGEPNSIQVFRNSGGTLDTLAAYTLLRSRRYSSCVAWADLNQDGYPELAVGGWWEPVEVFENYAGVLETIPAWSWTPSNPNQLVCEALVFGDVGNRHLAAVADTFSGNGQRKLFNLRRRPVQFLDSVWVEGGRLPSAAFCADLLLGWVGLAEAPPSGNGNVVVFYRYSTNPDLAVTNWDRPRGNHLFLNTAPAGMAGRRPETSPEWLRATPNPAVGDMTLIVAGADGSQPRSVSVYDLSGRAVRVVSRHGDSWIWDGRDADGRRVPPGVYLAGPAPGIPRLKLVRVGKN